MDHDLRYDSEETQSDLPAVSTKPVPSTKPANKPTMEPDWQVWTQSVNHRLRVLEQAVERIADTVQVLILRMDDGK